MADDDGLMLDGLMARLRQIGAAVTDGGDDKELWTLTTRDGLPMFIRNPTKVSPKVRLEMFKAIKARIDPFGRTH
jgi:hypothetical protein